MSAGEVFDLSSLRAAGRRFLRRIKYFTGDRPALLRFNLLFTPEGPSRVISPIGPTSSSRVSPGRATPSPCSPSWMPRQPTCVSQATSIIWLRYGSRSTAGLPLLVVCREPVACLSSYLVAGPHARPEGVIAEYIHHHRGVYEMRHDLVVATFDQVTTDLGAVIERVNARYGTDFDVFEHTPEAEDRVFEQIATHHGAVHRRKDPRRVVPTPRPGRIEEAEQHAAALQSPACRDDLAVAEALYSSLVEVATTES